MPAWCGSTDPANVIALHRLVSALGAGAWLAISVVGTGCNTSEHPADSAFRTEASVNDGGASDGGSADASLGDALDAAPTGDAGADEDAMSPRITYVKPTNTVVGMTFGWAAAAARADLWVAGSPNESSRAVGIDGDQFDVSASAAGAAYVYRFSGTWAQEAYVKSSNTDAGDVFGAALALSADGSTLAVGAPGESSSATGIDGIQSDNSMSMAGAVYVFRQTASGWMQEAYLKASNTDSGDWFGSSLALSADGSTLAVGAPHEASGASGVDGDQGDNGAPEAGAVYVFSRTASSWAQDAYVKASICGAGDAFGQAVALSDDGRTLAVGAPGEASAFSGLDTDPLDDSAFGAGAVYVFARSGSAWSQTAYIKASAPDSGDLFGFSVSLSSDGSSLAVGAIGEASGATGLDGDSSDDSTPGAGAVYVLGRDGATWTEQAYVKAVNTGEHDMFGFAAGLSDDGTVLLVGAPYEASGAIADPFDETAAAAGAVYEYRRTDAVWASVGYHKAPNVGSGDQFGCALALGGSGFVVGACREASAAAGVDADPSDDSAPGAGAAYAFD